MTHEWEVLDVGYKRSSQANVGETVSLQKKTECILLKGGEKKKTLRFFLVCSQRCIFLPSFYHVSCLLWQFACTALFLLFWNHHNRCKCRSYNFSTEKMSSLAWGVVTDMFCINRPWEVIKSPRVSDSVKCEKALQVIFIIIIIQFI